MAVQCLILSSGLKDCGHLLALASYRKAPIGVEHAFCLTPTDEDSHSATIVVLCFAIVCVYARACVSQVPCLRARPMKAAYCKGNSGYCTRLHCTMAPSGTRLMRYV